VPNLQLDDPQPFGPTKTKIRKRVRARAISCGPHPAGFSLTFDTEGDEVLIVSVDVASALFFMAGVASFHPEALAPVPVPDVVGD
jgi:hypothetical protein